MTNNKSNPLQTLIDSHIDEGIVIGMKKTSQNEGIILPFIKLSNSFYPVLVNSLIADPQNLLFIKTLIEILQETVNVAEEALKSKEATMN